MDAQDPKHHKERDETDASLLAERTKTDAELVKKRLLAEENESQIVEVARERAQETLGAARERADRDLVASGATPAQQREIARERVAADGALELERTAADEQLAFERQAHERALAALLRLEREATDEGLLVERVRADEMVATRDDFLGIVSHDLRNILGNIALGASRLTLPATPGGKVDAATMAVAERIQRGVLRMNRLLGDLLDVVSLEAGKLSIVRRAHDASQVVRDAVEAYQPSFVAKNVALAIELCEASVLADFDQERILQVLANLLGNALKFTESGGRVTLSMVATTSELRFSVTDTGVGIPAHQATAIFDRFGQVRRDRRGHGLGLYISKCIVEAHGGSIWTESPPTGGTALLFTIPVTSAAASQS